MSREIKFRIWDGNKNEWLGASDKDTLTYYGFHLVGEVMTVQSPPQWALDEGNVVEQYTGLKDKNGKEIYEGDIVKVRLIREDSDFCAMTGPIIYYKYKFCLDFNGPHSRGWTFHYESRFVEVLGNIHENPELLEGEE